jgi:hypothetical protein
MFQVQRAALALLLGFASLSRLRFAPPVGTLLLGLVVRMSLFVVLAALPAEEEQNLLRVAGTHTDSVRSWRVSVKRVTVGSLHG